MRVLVACECSGRVRDALLALGHDALSCDLEPSETPGPHHQGDVLPLLEEQWDLIIAFPPCTHLSCSGARYFKAKQADGRQQQGIDFFMRFVDDTFYCPRVAIENPVGIMSTRYRKPDQIIQPWMFGHPEQKATCLWLKGLPLLKPTRVLPKPRGGIWVNQTASGQSKLGPSPDRAKIRSRTYSGIAAAMAQQWTAVEDHGQDLQTK